MKAHTCKYLKNTLLDLLRSCQNLEWIFEYLETQQNFIKVLSWDVAQIEVILIQIFVGWYLAESYSLLFLEESLMVSLEVLI